MNVSEAIRPAPENEIREMGSRRIIVNVCFYLAVSFIAYWGSMDAVAGSWLWSIAVVGSAATFILAIPGAVELVVRAGDRV